VRGETRMRTGVTATPWKRWDGSMEIGLAVQ